MSQLDLFEKTLDERFAEFLDDNPDVWPQFVAFTMEAIRACQRRGLRPKVGAKAVLERCRWESWVGDGDPWRLNNDFTPCLSRKFMDERPEWRGVFETRERK